MIINKDAGRISSKATVVYLKYHDDMTGYVTGKSLRKTGFAGSASNRGFLKYKAFEV
jgi:hypothetical protein